MKSLLRMLLPLSLLVFAAACSGTGQNAEPVTFMVSGEPEELAAYETLVAGFNEAHPDIEVQLIYVAGAKEFREKIATMFSANVPPDVFLFNFRRLGDYAASGALHPLGDLMDASPLLARSDFYPVPLDAFTYDGVLQCIPQNLSSPVIFYNQALFESAGLPYPEEGWSLDEFIATAQALTRDLDGDGAPDQWGFGTEVETIRLAPFLWGNGGDFFDDPDNPSRLTLGEPAGREAVQWFVDLQLVHHVVPDIVAETAQSSEDRFLNGSVAMLMSSRVSVPALRTITAFTWDAAPLPIGDAPASVLHSDGFCMSAKAAEDQAHAEKVWTFIEYSLSMAGQELLAETGRTVPSLIAVAESEAFLESSPPANNQIWLDATEHMRAFPMQPGWNTFEELLSKELQRVYFGDSTVDEFLAKAADLAEPLIEP